MTLAFKPSLRRLLASHPSQASHHLRHSIQTLATLLASLVMTVASAGVPDSTDLRYEGKGLEGSFFRYNGTGTLHWQHDATGYQARLEIMALGMRIRTMSSTGEITSHGLQPDHFDDVPRSASWTTRFQRDKGLITFSSGSDSQPLQPGAQDKLSALLQLGVMLSEDPSRATAGNTIRFQAADAQRADNWLFQVSGAEKLDLPAGPLNAIKLTREPTPDNGQKLEVWLAPTVSYLPVRLRITENGGSFIDLLWRKTQNSD